MSEFFNMRGYGPYIWTSYFLGVGALLLTLWRAQRNLRRARTELRRRLAMRESGQGAS